jgi:hypothetical protein
MSDTDERRSLLARQLDLEQIRTETTALMEIGNAKPPILKDIE